MSKSLHTPGPWQTTSTLSRIDGPQFQRIANMYRAKSSAMRSPREVQDEADSNARLIAAAPDLLMALQDCITSEGALCFGDIQGNPHAMQRRLYAISDIARAAIAKATARG